MAGLLERLSAVVRAEIGGRRRARHEPHAEPHERGAAAAPPYRMARPDVESAWRMLELRPEAGLDEVRAAYFALARRYYPKAVGGPGGDAARTVVDALTDALEVLEEHLLQAPR